MRCMRVVRLNEGCEPLRFVSESHSEAAVLPFTCFIQFLESLYPQQLIATSSALGFPA